MRTSLKFTFLSTVFLLYTFSTQAQQASEVVNQQDWLTRNQQNILEETKRNHEFLAIKKDRKRQQEEEEDAEKNNKINVVTQTQQCFTLKEIKLTGANSIGWFSKRKIIANFIGKCLDEKTLSDIVQTINLYYHNNGNITAQILVPPQNLQSGTFELKIIEGKIEKISLNKDRFIDQMQKFTAFGAVEGRVLNINDINQGIYQINRLQSN